MSEDDDDEYVAMSDDDDDEDDEYVADINEDMAEKIDSSLIDDNFSLSGEDLIKMSNPMSSHATMMLLQDLNDFNLRDSDLIYVLCSSSGKAENHWVVIMWPDGEEGECLMMDTYGRHLTDLLEDFNLPPLDLDVDIISISKSIQNDYTVVCGYYCWLFAYFLFKRYKKESSAVTMSHWDDLFYNLPSYWTKELPEKAAALSLLNDETCKILCAAYMKNQPAKVKKFLLASE